MGIVMEANEAIGLKPAPETFRPAALAMEIYRDFEACGELADRWDEFVERVSGDIFLTWDWCRIWWKYYGKERQLRIYIFRQGSQWVGLMPMFLEKVSLGPVSLRRAKMVGSDFSLGQFRPAIEADFLRSVLGDLLADLRLMECDQLVLGPIAGRYALYPEMKASLRAAGSGDFQPPRELTCPQTYYPLEEDYDQWLGRFRAAQRGNIRRDYRNLERQSLRFYCERSNEANWEKMFEAFVRLHQAFWNGKGRLGHFGDWPQARLFHREVAQAQMEKGRLRLFGLWCADGSRAYAYRYRCGDMYFGLLLARSPSAPQGVSTCRLLHSEIVRYAIGESVRWIDAMRGHYEYKCLLGGECMELHTLLLNRNRLRSRLNARLFGGAACLFHFVYYKLYYSRLARKLPLRWRGGLRRSWVRTCSELRGVRREPARQKLRMSRRGLFKRATENV